MEKGDKQRLVVGDLWNLHPWKEHRKWIAVIPSPISSQSRTSRSRCMVDVVVL